MPHETYWLPYPALLKKLGFEKDYKDSWKMKTDGYTRKVAWFVGYGASKVDLQLADGPYTLFLGELQSEEEFLTLLRQVRWTT